MNKSFCYSESELLLPTILAIKALGGSANTDEIEEQIIKDLKLSEEQSDEIHRGTTTKLSYQLGWARYRLKKGGLIENSARAVWSLTPKGKAASANNNPLVIAPSQGGSDPTSDITPDSGYEEISNSSEFTWQENVLQILQSVDPDKFERFCQRLLRELGFTEVSITGRTGDGGIDGKGFIKIGGVLAFHIVFNAKDLRVPYLLHTSEIFVAPWWEGLTKGFLLRLEHFPERQKKRLKGMVLPQSIY
jgi:restriction system protein